MCACARVYLWGRQEGRAVTECHTLLQLRLFACDACQVHLLVHDACLLHRNQHQLMVRWSHGSNEPAVRPIGMFNPCVHCTGTLSRMQCLRCGGCCSPPSPQWPTHCLMRTKPWGGSPCVHPPTTLAGEAVYLLSAYYLHICPACDIVSSDDYLVMTYVDAVNKDNSPSRCFSRPSATDQNQATAASCAEFHPNVPALPPHPSKHTPAPLCLRKDTWRHGHAHAYLFIHVPYVWAYGMSQV